MANENRIPKGPSNSNQLAAFPGTQQTAAQNTGVFSPNINPNMPRGPQLARQGRSSYQGSITPSLAKPPIAGASRIPAPGAPVAPKRAAPVRQTPVVSRAMPMDPGRGYNVFSGMDADQISGMNQRMGMSNMTALPSLARSTPSLDPALTGSFMPPVRQIQRNVMDTDYTDAEGAEHDLNDTTKTVLVTGGSNPGVYSYAEYTERFGGDEDNYFVSDTIPSVTQQDLEKAEGTDGSAYAVAGGEDIGFDAEEKEALKQEIDDEYSSAKDHYEQAKESIDNEYAYKIDGLLAGLDRQMAMMGTFGSGAHSTSINNVVAGALADMADEYAAIEKGMADIDIQHAQDLKQIGLSDLAAGEVDWQQNYINAMTQAGFDSTEIQVGLQNAQLIDQNLVTSASGLIESLGDGDTKTMLYGLLGDATTGLYSSAYGDKEDQVGAIAAVEAAIEMIGVMAKVESGALTLEEAKAQIDNGSYFGDFGEDVMWALEAWFTLPLKTLGVIGDVASYAWDKMFGWIG